MSVRSKWLGAALCAAVAAVSLGSLFSGCGPSGKAGPVVIEIGEGKVTLADLTREHDMLNGEGSFAQLPLEDRKAFLSTIADKEILIRLAKAETGGLKPPYDRLAREAADAHLYEAFDRLVVWPTLRDTAATMAVVEKFKREILLDWLVTRSDSVSNLARREVLAGMPFADAVQKYSMDDSTRKMQGRIPWVGPETMGIEFAKELFLETRAPGYISEMRGTPRGFEFFRVVDYRPADPVAKAQTFASYPELANLIRAYDRRNEFNDSLKTAHGFELVPDNVRVVWKRMGAYWDSVSVAGRNAPQNAIAFQPPLAAFPQEDLALPLYRSDGKDVSISEFFETLRTVPMTMWPTGRKLDVVEAQIEKRVLQAWRMDLARAKGLDKMDAYLWRRNYEEEKQLLEAYQKDVLSKEIAISPEEIQAYYQSNLERYRTEDRARFSYINFNDEAEARRFQEKAATGGDSWWARYIGKFERSRKDLKVVASTDPIDMTKPVDPEIQKLCEWARDKKVLDISPVIRTPDGKFQVAMLQMRSHPGIQPLDRVARAIQKTLEEERMAKLVDERLAAGRTTFKQKVYSERLAEKS